MTRDSTELMEPRRQDVFFFFFFILNVDPNHSDTSLLLLGCADVFSSVAYAKLNI